MKTLVLYAGKIKRAEAYHLTNAKEMWGPLWAFISRKDRDEGHLYRREPGLITIPVDETFESYVQKQAPGYMCERTTLDAGWHYPRIWRTGMDIERYGEAVPRVEDTAFHASFVNSLEQLEGLFDDLLSIFRVVHPVANNLDTYGGTLRDIIILACTEVEAQWKAVLKANAINAAGDYFKTTDYVKLLPVLKLDDYEVSLFRYPEISTITPFVGWDATKSTKSLPWYDAYNQVKHGREDCFHQASLNNAINAVAACVVILAAQFGVEALKRHDLKPLFEFRKRPMWEPKDWYYEPVPGHDWNLAPCIM